MSVLNIFLNIYHIRFVESFYFGHGPDYWCRTLGLDCQKTADDTSRVEADLAMFEDTKEFDRKLAKKIRRINSNPFLPIIDLGFWDQKKRLEEDN